MGRRNREPRAHRRIRWRALGLALALGALPQSSPAEDGLPPHVRDPKKLLAQIDRFLERPPFARAFPCGTRLSYELTPCGQFCEPFACQAVCQDTKRHEIELRACTPDSVQFYNLTQDQAWFTLTKKQYDAAHFVRAFLDAPLATPDAAARRRRGRGQSYVELVQLSPQSYRLEDGKERAGLALELNYLHFHPSLGRYMPSRHRLLIGKHRDSLGLHVAHESPDLPHPMARLRAVHPAGAPPPSPARAQRSP